MDHTMVLSYDYSNRNRRRQRTNAPPLRAIWWPWRWAGARRIAQCSMTKASPEATGRRHRATTHSVLPHGPPGRQSTQRWCNMYSLCWPFWWLLQCGSTILRASTKRHHRASTCSDRHQTDMPTPISGVYFIIKLLKKSSSCHNNNRGVTHQTDEKHLNYLLGWFN